MDAFKEEAEYLKMYVATMSVETIESELRAFYEIVKRNEIIGGTRKSACFPTDHLPHTNC